MSEGSPTRPKHVVIVDAENPMTEVLGDFFWREDHDRLLAAAREQAYSDGFAEGYTAAQRHRPTTVVLRRRRRRLARLLLALVVLAFFLSLVVTALETALGR